MEPFEQLLKQYAMPGKSAGLIGAGRFGMVVRRILEDTGMHIMLFDPPRELLQSNDAYDDYRTETQWGNGMGGCQYDGSANEIFLPLSHLLKNCVLITVQVPLTAETCGMIDPDFLKELRSDACLLNFSGPDVIDGTLHDPRIMK